MIDHVFILIDPDGQDFAQMAAMGLVETYRRTHPGQGTRNICYCFDNLFLELLWVDDPDAARSPGIRRTALYERSLWRTNGACPFGVAWRPCLKSPSMKIDTWSFTPPYLPQGASIAVAVDGDDAWQPMMFESPGVMPPCDWPVEKRGSLQHSAGLGAVRAIEFEMPRMTPPCDTLRTVANICAPRMLISEADDYSLRLHIARLHGGADMVLTLPL